MARVRVYIKPFNEAGDYQADYIEVTDDVVANGISPIRQRLDVNDFDIGLVVNAAIQLTVRNDHGRFAAVGNPNSIFRYKRADSLVKITWDQADYDYISGIVDAESFMNNEVTVFIGLLDDENSSMSLKDYHLKFAVLGRESIFDRVLVPFDDIGNGDTVKEILEFCFDQDAITDILTYSAANIDPSYDAVIDDVSQFENKTVKEALNLLLTVSNSVCYVEDDTIYVRSREEGATIAHNFYGQGSESGRENIVMIDDSHNGLRRTINFITWQETSLSAGEADSIIRHGYKKKEISLEGITNNTTKQAVLNAIRDEFGNPKREFKLTTPITYDVLELLFLDKCSIDFPELVTSHSEFPIYDVALYGEARYPTTLAGFSISASEEWKIIGKEIDLLKGNVAFNFREV